MTQDHIERCLHPVCLGLSPKLAKVAKRKLDKAAELMDEVSKLVKKELPNAGVWVEGSGMIHVLDDVGEGGAGKSLLSSEQGDFDCGGW